MGRGREMKYLQYFLSVPVVFVIAIYKILGVENIFQEWYHVCWQWGVIWLIIYLWARYGE